MIPSGEVLGAAGILSALDLYFARAMQRISGDARPEVFLAAALASRGVANGHVCLDLRRQVETPLNNEETGEPIADAAWPSLVAWLASLRDSPLIGSEQDAEPRPLLLDAHGRLYLRRYWEHECTLAATIAERARDVAPDVDEDVLRAGLRRLFPAPGVEPDWQRVAALTAVRRRFCVISGGPGTGKTYTVIKILALLAEQFFACHERPPRVFLVAPTGKAAARLRESILQAKRGLDCEENIRQAIPEEASTIHRCLGSVRDSDTRFRHGRERPLLADVVLVDEASMVDVALMARLVDALPANSRLVLLGDENQLASVEAGAVLGDICSASAPRMYSSAFADDVKRLAGDELPRAPDMPADTGIWDCIVRLTRSYRYGEHSAIGALARAINDGDGTAALAALRAGPEASLAPPVIGEQLGEPLHSSVVQHYGEYLAECGAAARLRALDCFRVLCAHRRGPGGVEPLNEQIVDALAAAGRLRRDGPYYPGRAVIVTRNDYSLRLFNGDVGVIVESADEDGRPLRRVAFAAEEGAVRELSPSRLPPHETVFAMTVHKSQGSEFDEVAVVLPPELSPVLTRELLYTAVTRARSAVRVYAAPEIIAAAVARRVQRASGLRDRLWG
jgi:exodeoxyribonuclease V alpha subunit